MEWFYFNECTTGCNLFNISISNHFLCNVLSAFFILLVILGAATIMEFIYNKIKKRKNKEK